MILLTGVLIVLSINNRYGWKTLSHHPLVILIFVQFILFGFNIFTSIEPVLSFKYLLAKIWFIGSCVFIPIYCLREEKQFKNLFWGLFIGLLITVIYTVLRHATTGFGFEDVNPSSKPFYLNHVNYSCFIALIFPFVLASLGWYKVKSLQFAFIASCSALLLFAIVTSYTRTTWLSIILASVSIVIFNTKYLKHSILLGLIAVFSFAYYLIDDNRYIKYAPDYQHTYFNQEDFEKHMEATVEMSDVSGMERVYRWVAAINLIEHHFWFGTGNNTFYPTYKEYANPAFVTYVSHNPEKSSTHNYFLLLFCDQGVFGFLIFVVFYLWALIRSHTIYRSTDKIFIKTLMMASFASLVIFLVHLALGDMVEVDKTGGLFYLIIALIIISDRMIKVPHLSSNASLSPEENTLKA